MICLLLRCPYWISTKCPAGQLSQMSSVISWEPKTIKNPCTFPDFRVVILATGLPPERAFSANLKGSAVCVCVCVCVCVRVCVRARARVRA